MFAKIFAVGLLAAAAVSANPVDKRAAVCMTEAQANSVAANFGTLISNFSASLARSALSKNYTDYSESVNTLIDSCPTGTDSFTVPLEGATVPNRATFIAAQKGQPDNTYTQNNIWYSCTSVGFRWTTTNGGGGPRPVTGIVIAEVIHEPTHPNYPWLIDEVYSEFDAGAWLQNLVDNGKCPATACADTSSTVSATATPTASATTTLTAIPSSSNAAAIALDIVL